MRNACDFLMPWVGVGCGWVHLECFHQALAGMGIGSSMVLHMLFCSPWTGKLQWKLSTVVLSLFVALCVCSLSPLSSWGNEEQCSGNSIYSWTIYGCHLSMLVHPSLHHSSTHPSIPSPPIHPSTHHLPIHPVTLIFDEFLHCKHSCTRICRSPESV